MDALDHDALVVWKTLLFLRRAWPHTPRSVDERDQGFERTFRQFIWAELRPDRISFPHDLGFAEGLSTLSGLAHELDLLALWEEQQWVFELKNGGGCEVSKDMVMVFQEKVLDFYLANLSQLSQLRVMRAFLTGAGHIEDGLRAYCAIWGIVLIDNELLPIPLLPALLKETRKRLNSGELPDEEADAIEEAERIAEVLVDSACRPLGEIIELADMRDELTIRLDRIPTSASAAKMVGQHRAISAQIHVWNELRHRRGA